MITAIASIALGGAAGAVMRHGVNAAALHLWGPGFPWGTFIVNVAGSFVMGVLIAAFAHYGNPSQPVRLFLLTGLLGAFTTFSAFSLDVAVLWERGALSTAMLYTLGSVTLSIAALFAGMVLIRAFAS